MITMKAYKATFEDEDAILLKNNIETVREVFDIEDDDKYDTIALTIVQKAKVGYLTDEGMFLTPEEALEHSIECGQLSDYAQKVVKVNNMKKFQMSLLKL